MVPPAQRIYAGRPWTSAPESEPRRSDNPGAQSEGPRGYPLEATNISAMSAPILRAAGQQLLPFTKSAAGDGGPWFTIYPTARCFRRLRGDLVLPQTFSFGANYPNPFNPTTTIAMSATFVTCSSVYDVRAVWSPIWWMEFVPRCARN